MKTIMDAVNELKADLDNTYMLSLRDTQVYYCKDDNDYVCGTGGCSAIKNRVCSIFEFIELVSQLETNFGKSVTYAEYKATCEKLPFDKPIYTQAMCDAGELPSVGMEVRYTPIENDSNTTLEAGQYVHGKIIAYHGGFVWTSDNGLRKLSNTRFKPVLPPITLIDGETYQFDVRSTGRIIKAIYNKFDNKLHVSDGQWFDVESADDIKHLTLARE